MISIIIPMFNTEKTIGRCLESIFRQEYKSDDVEVLVIDDGSIDGGAEIVKSYMGIHPQISYYYQSNQGASAARNLGLQKASGDYICFIDADDEISPKFLSTLMPFFPSSDIVICGTTVYMNGIIVEHDAVKETLHRTGQELMTDVLYKRNSSYTMCNKIFKKEVLKGFRFPIGMMYEDLYASVFTTGKIKNGIIIPDELYYYYRHSDSVSTKVADKQLIDYEKVISLISEEMKKYYDVPVLMKAFLNFLYYTLFRTTRYYLRNKGCISEKVYWSTVTCIVQLIQLIRDKHLVENE